MTVIEYVSVFVSIVLGLAAAELGTSFHRIMRARKRVKWDWMSLALAFYMLLNVVAVWWASYLWYATKTELRMVEFLPDLAILVLTYLAAAAVLPDEIPPRGLDLKEYYFETAPYFWSLNALLLALAIVILGPRYTGGVHIAAIAKEQAANIILLTLALALIFVRRPWFHTVAIVYIVGLTAWDYLTTGALNLHAAG
ncbi:MAG TPA: hypothetical protein VF079_09725 [Sphingomicrobium sp.]